MSRRQGNARATHLDSRMVPSGRRAGRAPDHGRFASSPRAVVAVVVVVISCRASTGQSIGSRMTWDGSSRTPLALDRPRSSGRDGHTVGSRRRARRRAGNTERATAVGTPASFYKISKLACDPRARGISRAHPIARWCPCAPGRLTVNHCPHPGPHSPPQQCTARPQSRGSPAHP